VGNRREGSLLVACQCWRSASRHTWKGSASWDGAREYRSSRHRHCRCEDARRNTGWIPVAVGALMREIPSWNARSSGSACWREHPAGGGPPGIPPRERSPTMWPVKSPIIDVGPVLRSILSDSPFKHRSNTNLLKSLEEVDSRRQPTSKKSTCSVYQLKQHMRALVE